MYYASVYLTAFKTSWNKVGAAFLTDAESASSRNDMIKLTNPDRPNQPRFFRVLRSGYTYRRFG
jgi:hypothetical protein